MKNKNNKNSKSVPFKGYHLQPETQELFDLALQGDFADLEEALDSYTLENK